MSSTAHSSSTTTTTRQLPRQLLQGEASIQLHHSMFSCCHKLIAGHHHCVTRLGTMHCLAGIAIGNTLITYLIY
jgi:hypothetical protein